MVADGLSAQRIKRYLHRWTLWWVRTSDRWQYEERLEWFLRVVCWDEDPAAFAASLLQRITYPAVQCRAPGAYQLRQVFKRLHEIDGSYFI